MLLMRLFLRMNSTYFLWLRMKVAPARPPKALRVTNKRNAE